MNAVIYARYSSDNQREESIEGQIRENTAFAEKNGMTIVGHYIDRAYSARTDKRPEFQRMIRDSAKKNFDVVIVWKLDRFARNRYDSAKYKAALKKNDVKVVSATEAISEGAEGIILEAVLEGYAEYYSVDLSEKILRGMTENALKCKYNGSHVPLGFRIDEDRFYQIDESKAPIVREIYERYASGETGKSIITDLNDRGLKTTTGKPFVANSLHSILTNRMYIGEYHHGAVVKPGGIPAIVSRELFDRVAARMEKNKRGSGHNKGYERYILSTKLFCGKCRSMMVGESAQKKNGMIYRYYKCASAKRKKGCDMRAVRKDWIEALVINKLVSILNDRDTLNKMADAVLALFDEENAAVPALEAQLKETHKAIDNLMKAIESGIITRTTKSRLEELEKEEERILQCIDTEKAKQPMLSKEMILFTLEKFRNLDLSVGKNRERLVDGFVKCIILEDDRIIITTTFRDEPVTIITKEEIETIADHGSDVSGSSPPQKSASFRMPIFVWWSKRIEPSSETLRWSVSGAARQKRTGRGILSDVDFCMVEQEDRTVERNAPVERFGSGPAEEVIRPHAACGRPVLNGPAEAYFQKKIRLLCVKACRCRRADPAFGPDAHRRQL